MLNGILQQALKSSKNGVEKTDYSPPQLVMSKEVYLNRQIPEPLHGPGAELIEKLVQIQPGMILIDLDFAKIPWKDWIAWIKSAPATRRIPVICICNHVNKAAFNAAKSAGADKVIARSGIIKLLPEVVNRYIRIVDYEKLRESCEGLLSKKALRGIELFNLGEFFEAHEYLEKAWNEDPCLGKELYGVILQVAVASLQLERLILILSQAMSGSKQSKLSDKGGKMKRILFTLSLILAAVNAYAAGTCVESGTNPTYIYHGQQVAGEGIPLLCTHHTDNSLSGTVATSTMAKLSGRYFYAIKSKPGSTAPTDNTDLSIVDSDSLSLIGVADNWLDFIDATTTKETIVYNATTGLNVYRMPVGGEAWTISTANNAVASATFYLKIYLVP